MNILKYAKRQLQGPNFKVLLDGASIGTEVLVSTTHHQIMKCLIDADKLIKKHGKGNIANRQLAIKQMFQSADKKFTEIQQSGEDLSQYAVVLLGFLTDGRPSQMTWQEFCDGVVETSAMETMLTGAPIRARVLKEPAKFQSKAPDVQLPTEEDNEMLVNHENAARVQ